VGAETPSTASSKWLHALPDVVGEGVAYRQLAADLRRSIAAGRWPTGSRLPTEAEVVAATGLSRNTVRRAFQDLVSEGVIYRVRGRGTYVVPGHAQYVRSFGSIGDLMNLSLDTEMEIVEPLHVRASLEIANELAVEDDTVMAMSFIRIHEGIPLCYTRVHVPLALGAELRELPELRELSEPGLHSRTTIISLIEKIHPGSIQGAQQTITAEIASLDTAHRLNCEAGCPVLRIERLYCDQNQRPLELAINRFHPEHYSYRLQIRGGMERSDLSGSAS
jgi:GntR family transcriptional regulator